MRFELNFYKTCKQPLSENCIYQEKRKYETLFSFSALYNWLISINLN